MKASIIIIWLTSVAAFGQVEKPLISPDVHPNRTATFRINAPRASKVALVGDWMGGEVEPMTRNDQGVWSITVGPESATNGSDLPRFSTPLLWRWKTKLIWELSM